MKNKVMELMNTQMEARNVLALQIIEEAKESLKILGLEDLLNTGVATVTREVEVIKEVPVEVEKVDSVPQDVSEDMLDLNSLLEREIAFSRENFTDLTIAAIKKSNDLTLDKLNMTLSQYAFVFDNDNAYILVFCFANEEEVNEIIKSQEFNLGSLTYSTATLNEKSTPESLIKEAITLL